MTKIYDPENGMIYVNSVQEKLKSSDKIIKQDVLGYSLQEKHFSMFDLSLIKLIV